jgi:hypothetical protein
MRPQKQEQLLFSAAKLPIILVKVENLRFLAYRLYLSPGLGPGLIY